MFLMLGVVKKNPTIAFACLVLKAYVFLKHTEHSAIQKNPSLSLEQSGLAVLEAEFGGRISVAPTQLNHFLVQHLIPYLEYFLLQGCLQGSVVPHNSYAC